MLWTVILIAAVVFVVVFIFGSGEPDNPVRPSFLPKQTDYPMQTAKRTTTKSNGVVVYKGKSEEMTMYVEPGTFPDDAAVSTTPVPEELIKQYSNTGKFDRIVMPTSISSDQYDGTFFGTDVMLTLPMPRWADDGEQAELSRYVFAYYDENSKTVRHLWPTEYDIENNTMSVRLPHFSNWWSGRLSRDEEIEAFLDDYSMRMAVQSGRKKQAAAELEPYVAAKVKALGMTSAAAKDLIQATVNALVAQATTDYQYDEQEKEFDYQESYGYTTGTNAMTSLIRGVWDGDSETIDGAINDLVNTTIMGVWDDYKFSKRGVEALFKSEYVQELAPKTVSTTLSNMGGIGSIAGRIAGGDTPGALEELGNLLQGIHPAVSITTKGAKFLASTANTAFTYWKANEVEELYHVYKNGTSGWFGNDVEPCNKESFLEYLNYSGGFTKAKGVYRFYNMDKVAEVCEKFGWSRKDFDQLDENYKNTFLQRAEDGLLEYFELRRQQEEEAARIKAAERECIKYMLNPSYGVLCSSNFGQFFGEKSEKDYNVTRRLERLVNVREFISQFVNEKELAKVSKVEDSFNYGSLINEWVSLASRYPKDKAIEKFCEYLESIELLKIGIAPQTPKTSEYDDLVAFLVDLGVINNKLDKSKVLSYEFERNGNDVKGHLKVDDPSGTITIEIINKDKARWKGEYGGVWRVKERGKESYYEE